MLELLAQTLSSSIKNLFRFYVFSRLEIDPPYGAAR